MDDRRLGAVLGALVGDAAGAVLEFYPGKITRNATNRAMHMPGGGSLNVASGQITDSYINFD
jgi:ADP-ribosylglycohydrolase